MYKKELMEQIAREYQDTTCSMKYLGRKYGISRDTIKKFFDKKDIPTKYFKQHLIDPKDVVNKYVVERMRVEDVAEIYHCSIAPINRILRKYGVKRKQSESLKGRMVGDKNPNWKGGKTNYSRYTISIKGFKYKMRIWSAKVIERDNIQCKLCGSDENLNAHHIEPVRNCKLEILFDVNNGITLCRKCHLRIHLKEENYKEEFKKLLSGSV
jgi:5-methylcytosine-specific restriction endonuclease McrA